LYYLEQEGSGVTKNLILTFLLLLSKNIFALNCPLSFGPTEVAIEIFKFELSGARVDGMAEHECMKQENHPYIKVTSGPTDEKSSKASFFLGRKDPYKLGRLVILDKETFTYKAIFEFQAKNKLGKKEKVRTAFQFLLYKDKSSQSIHGCGALTEAPRVIVIYDDCKEEN